MAFELTSRQSRVAQQNLLNLIQQLMKEMLIQTSSYRDAKVEHNSSIEFDMTIAWRFNWALASSTVISNRIDQLAKQEGLRQKRGGEEEWAS